MASPARETHGPGDKKEEISDLYTQDGQCFENHLGDSTKLFYRTLSLFFSPSFAHVTFVC